MKSDLDSSAIICKLRAGGEDQLATFFAAHRDSLRKMIAVRISSLLSARLDASDILQESFMKARNQLRNYLVNPEVHPAVWLRLVCKQVVAEVSRKNMRSIRSPRLEIREACDELLIENVADSVHSVCESTSRKELLNWVSQVMAQLDQTDREIIEMRHSEGMSFSAIAGALEMKMETAKKRYYRNLKKFRDLARKLNYE